MKNETQLQKWFECKIQLEKMIENGLTKAATETYMVDALSFTEAEARITAEMAPFVTGGFKVLSIKKANYSELFSTEDNVARKWFKVKLEIQATNEKTGKEKPTSCYYLIQASDLKDTLKRLDEIMSGSMFDYSSVSVQETKIMDVFKHE